MPSTHKTNFPSFSHYGRIAIQAETYGSCLRHAKDAEVLSSITISVGQPPVLRFFGGGRKVIHLAGGSTSGKDGAVSSEGSDLLREALARLGACEDLIRDAQRQRSDLTASATDAGPPGVSFVRGHIITPPDDDGSSPFGSDGPFPEGVDVLLIPGTLHRVAALRDGLGAVSGLTYRVGRQLESGGARTTARCRQESDVADPPLDPSVRSQSFTLGSFAPLLADIVQSLFSSPGAAGGLNPHAAAAETVSGNGTRRGLLVVGPVGSGKTALLRDLARIAALRFNRAVLVRQSLLLFLIGREDSGRRRILVVVVVWGWASKDLFSIRLHVMMDKYDRSSSMIRFVSPIRQAPLSQIPRPPKSSLRSSTAALRSEGSL